MFLIILIITIVLSLIYRHRVFCLYLCPVGIFAWIAFSLLAIMVNYGYIISVFSDPLGLGWDLLGTADTHFKALIPDWIPVIQGIVLLAGLYLGVNRGFMAIKDLLPDSRTQIRSMVLPSIFAILAVNLLLKLYMGKADRELMSGIKALRQEYISDQRTIFQSWG